MSNVILNIDAIEGVNCPRLRSLRLLRSGACHYPVVKAILKSPTSLECHKAN